MSLTITPDDDRAQAPGAVTTIANDTTAILRIIADAAQNPAVDVAKMEALLNMQERILARQAEASFNHALARLTALMPRVKKNGRVDLGKGGGGYDFARWEDMDAVIRPLTRQEGFTLSFDTEPREGGGAVVVGTLLHQDGHSRQARISLPADGGAGRNNLQAMGSTLSYGKRYVAEMLLNIVREGADDDGQAGGPVTLSDAQAAEIERDLDALTKFAPGDNHRELFLRHMKVGRVADISEGDFRKAKGAIQGRIARLNDGGGQ